MLKLLIVVGCFQYAPSHNQSPHICGLIKTHCMRAKICIIMLSMSAITLRKSTLHPLFDFLHVLHHQKSVSVQKHPYCTVCPTKNLSGLYQHRTQALRSKSSASYIHLEIEEHIYTVIVSFVYLLIIELLYGKISAGRLLWMSEHY